MVTDRELYQCVGDTGCRVWDPDNQPSVLAKLKLDPNAYKDRTFMFVRTGQYLYGHPLWVELMLCERHSKEMSDE